MSEQQGLNPFSKSSMPLAVECSHCTQKRELFKRAQQLVDQIQPVGRRAFLPPIQCGHCEDGWILTSAGETLAILMHKHVEKIAKLTAADKIPF